MVIVRIEVEGLVEVLNCPAVLAQLCVCNSPVPVDFGGVGFNLKRFVVFLYRLSVFF